MATKQTPEISAVEWDRPLKLIYQLPAVDAALIFQLSGQQAERLSPASYLGEQVGDHLLDICGSRLKAGVTGNTVITLSHPSSELLLYPLFDAQQALFGGLAVVCQPEGDAAAGTLAETLAARINYDLLHSAPAPHASAPDGEPELPSLQTFIDAISDHVWIKDTQGVYICANRSVSEAWGGCPLGQTDSDMFDLERTRLFEAADHKAIAAGKQIVTEECSNALDPDKDSWLETVKSPLLDDDGKLLGVLGMTRNVTQRKLVEEQLSLAATVFANSVEGVMITDKLGTIIEINDSFSEITGYQREEVLGRNPRLLQSGKQSTDFYHTLWDSLLNQGRWQGEMWNRNRQGAVYPCFMTITAVYDEQQAIRYFVGIFSDISQQKQSEAKLAHMAYHDPLTNLPNRTQLKSRLQQEIRYAKRHSDGLALVFLDVDHFKHINDSVGHLVGDEVLREISTRLSQRLRLEDMVARIGGDEFVVLLNGIKGIESATRVVSKLMSIFAEPLRVSTGDQLKLTGSMGVALYPFDGEDSDTLLRNADAAMYRAKRCGRNNFAFYTESLTRKSMNHLKLQAGLHNALAQKQFFLCYQPQINICSGELAGFEALLRWQHPEQGLVSPAEFIPVAERLGLIADIGLWVIRETCLQGRAWLDKGYRFGRIAVNVAAHQLQSDTFVANVQRILEETDFPAAWLELEVTEGVVMRNPKQATRTLLGLRKLGIELALDDFGTGYSSLSYLKRLPINKLKIDRSFIRDLPDDLGNKAISEAILAMGKALSIRVVAEGVERPEQAELLQQIGCKYVQGYLYSKPETAADIEPLLLTDS